MRIHARLMVATAVCGLSLSQAQDVPQLRDGAKPELRSVSANQSDDSGALNQDDRLSLIAAALDARVRRSSEPDCSHLIHAIYERAGLPYAYAPSSDLYAGVEGFERVKQPEPGDLVVWRGHVGIVIQPSQHIFFSFMRSGPGTDDYQAPYWKSRGHPRFYRYVKNTLCIACKQRPREVVRVKR
jgi:hypothetical protein